MVMVEITIVTMTIIMPLKSSNINNSKNFNDPIFFNGVGQIYPSPHLHFISSVLPLPEHVVGIKLSNSKFQHMYNTQGIARRIS
jgi:hypothetical protein